MKKYKSIGSHITTEQSCSTGLPLCGSVVFNMEEIWKDIIGYEGLYQISNLGNVKSLKRFSKRGKIGDKPINERILKKNIVNAGYRHVTLSKNNIQILKI